MFDVPLRQARDFQKQNVNLARATAAVRVVVGVSNSHGSTMFNSTMMCVLFMSFGCGVDSNIIDFSPLFPSFCHASGWFRRLTTHETWMPDTCTNKPVGGSERWSAFPHLMNDDHEHS